MSDLEKAFTRLTAKQDAYTALWNFYDGNQPLEYVASRLKNLFEGLDVRFTENWCAVVIDACKERLNLSGFNVNSDESAQKTLDLTWADLGMGLEADDVHEAALVIGESFLIVWLDERGRVAAYYNDPRAVHVEYHADNPRELAWASKWWIDEDTLKRHIALYYPDRFEHYVSVNRADQIIAWNENAFSEYEPPQTNAYGVIPVFHFRISRRNVKSDLANVIPLQNAINNLMIDMLVAAEYAAITHKWIVSHVDIADGTLKNRPAEIWNLPASDGVGQGTQVGEFTPADLQRFLEAMDKIAAAIGAITRTPKHYFFTQGGDPSGEALIAMESSLVKKVNDRMERFAPTWRNVAAFILQLRGQTVDLMNIDPVFDDPRTVLPLTTAQIRKASVESGLPLTTALRDEGRSQAEIEQIYEDKQTEAEQVRSTLAAALLNQQRAFDQNSQ